MPWNRAQLTGPHRHCKRCNRRFSDTGRAYCGEACVYAEIEELQQFYDTHSRDLQHFSTVAKEALTNFQVAAEEKIAAQQEFENFLASINEEMDRALIPHDTNTLERFKYLIDLHIRYRAVVPRGALIDDE